MTEPIETLTPEQLATATGGFAQTLTRWFRAWRAAVDARNLEEEFGMGHLGRRELPRR
jgi:hypothetical protein